MPGFPEYSVDKAEYFGENRACKILKFHFYISRRFIVEYLACRTEVEENRILSGKDLLM